MRTHHVNILTEIISTMSENETPTIATARPMYAVDYDDDQNNNNNNTTTIFIRAVSVPCEVVVYLPLLLFPSQVLIEYLVFLLVKRS